LPLKERWSARYFPLSQIFQPLETSAKTASKVEIDWFYDASEWDNYVSYMGSDNLIKKPYHGLTKTHVHVKIPYTEEE
jgi:hypothetical protein